MADVLKSFSWASSGIYKHEFYIERLQNNIVEFAYGIRR